jgi:molecular chaperone GrpE
MTENSNGHEKIEEPAVGTPPEEVAPASDPVQTELEQLRASLKEQQSKYLYLYAEFENYKKRTIRERSDLLKFGHEGFARELLQVSDNFDRALEHTENVEALVTGLKLVKQQLKDSLSRFSVLEVNSVGTKFDPQLHEAVGQEKSDNGQEDGTVIREHQKGYTIHGRLLRPARVVIASK